MKPRVLRKRLVELRKHRILPLISGESSNYYLRCQSRLRGNSSQNGPVSRGNVLALPRRGRCRLGNELRLGRCDELRCHQQDDEETSEHARKIAHHPIGSSKICLIIHSCHSPKLNRNCRGRQTPSLIVHVSAHHPCCTITSTRLYVVPGVTVTYRGPHQILKFVSRDSSRAVETRGIK